MLNKEYIKWLKENDPILYSELTSDPVTGLKGNDIPFIAIIVWGIIIGIAAFIIF